MGKLKGKRKKSERSKREASRLRTRLKRQNEEYRAKERERSAQYLKEKMENDPNFKVQRKVYTQKWKAKKAKENPDYRRAEYEKANLKKRLRKAKEKIVYEELDPDLVVKQEEEAEQEKASKLS